MNRIGRRTIMYALLIAALTLRSGIERALLTKKKSDSFAP
jgi:hypothetical protein